MCVYVRPGLALSQILRTSQHSPDSDGEVPLRHRILVSNSHLNMRFDISKHGRRMRRAMQRDAILSKDRLRQECTAAAAAFDAHLAVSAARASAVSASSAPNSPIKHSEQSEPEQSEPVLPASASSRAQSLLDDSASAGNGCHDESASHVIPPRVRTPRHHRPASTCGDSAGPAGGNDLYKSCADLRGRLQPCVQDLGSSSKKNAAPTCPGSSKSASN